MSSVACNQSSVICTRCRIHRQTISLIPFKILYKSLVLPLLEYGSVLFDNCTLYLKQRLENFQTQTAVVCTCTCVFRNTSYNRLLEELGWNTLDERRKLTRLNIFCKMNHEYRPCEANDPCSDCKSKVGVPRYLTGIARLVHVFDLNLTTQILIFPCKTCSVSATK